MPKFFETLSPELGEWCLKQSVFWTATAPLVGKHINVSPKGILDSAFAVLGPNQAAYVDLTGSGAETISHLYDNGRITILFNSFDVSPRILRLFCNGRVLEADNPEFAPMIEKIGAQELVGVRAVILLDIFKVQTSCGFGVPIASVTHDSEDGVAKPCFENRPTIASWATTKVEKGQMGEYQAEWNHDSLDGLPGMKSARRGNGENLLLGDAKAWVRKAFAFPEPLMVGVVLGAFMGTFVGSFIPRLIGKSLRA
ncbi:pyridoxamine phosphate oxidase family protein [Geopyxis carbonaria]|nr:pyridoxamine phosphate oxidase family protein [Geopyxis carbonaria]